MPIGPGFLTDFVLKLTVFFLGSYNPVITIKPTYQSKQSSTFLSKSHRLFDIRKGAVANQNLLEKLEEQTKYSQHSTNVSSKNWQSTLANIFN